jgi:hypothetical protein
MAPESSAMPLWLKATTPLVLIPLRKYSSLISLLGVQKLLAASFHCAFSIPYNPLTLMGISESGTDFSQNGNSGEDGTANCLLEHSQVKTVAYGSPILGLP